MCSSQESHKVLIASLPTTCCTSVGKTAREVKTGRMIRSEQETSQLSINKAVIAI